MAFRWSARPLVPVLVQAAALAGLPSGCGDDGSSGETSDVFPTAGPCTHDPDAAECGSTGVSATSTSSGTSGTNGGTSDSTSDGTTTMATSTTDTFPTAGPCVHEPDAPGCDSTGPDTTGTSSDTDGTGSSGTSG